ncbi:MAG: SDR family NAD(P)-dependent oxidoreductase [Clostridiales bacterium]|nr:SDR family NAD(P)-dependent oxidoreductase [Clostridiales bacterium]
MRILITGAAGFIGSNLVERLLRDGHHVIGLDNLSSGKLEFLNKSLKNSKFEFYRVDLIKDDISEYFHNVDEVWHLAANAEVRKYNMHIFMEQVEMTRRVLNAMEKTDVKK